MFPTRHRLPCPPPTVSSSCQTAPALAVMKLPAHLFVPLQKVHRRPSGQPGGSFFAQTEGRGGEIPERGKKQPGAEMGAKRPKEFGVEDAKWDDAIDLTLRRVVYSTLGGAVAAFALFRTRTTRWSAVAFGAGWGLGSATRDCADSLGPDAVSPFDFKVHR